MITVAPPRHTRSRDNQSVVICIKVTFLAWTGRRHDYIVGGERKKLSTSYAVYEGDQYLGDVAYCKDTREWLAWDSQQRFWSSYGKTRSEAAEALIGQRHMFFKEEPEKARRPRVKA